MKTLNITFLTIVLVVLWGCGGGGKSDIDRIREQSKMEPTDPYESWATNHGVGPVKAFTLEATVDEAMAAQGAQIFESKCTACHKPDKKFIGPAPKDILTRRTPAWVMNMILNPDNMVQQDPIAKKLLMEFNGSPMANQSLTQEEARAVLEYFRTL